MKASIVDLRYKMKKILQALDRNEIVTIMYRGREKGVITPYASKKNMKVVDHPFFGMLSGDKENVEKIMDGLRKARY